MPGVSDGRLRAMKKPLLRIILRLAKLTGLFLLARRLTAGDLRILCYHGAALRDENHFSPGLFMSKETFAGRMDFLARQGYPVIGLDAAIAGLPSGDWPKGATVITIDDGWFGTYREMAPVLRKRGFPATLYIASYYLEKETQVFNVAVNYVLWRAGRQTLDLAEVSDELGGRYDIADARLREELRRRLGDFADSLGSAEARQELFRRLCETLGIDACWIEQERLCAFMRIEEARELQASGVDIQLHSHRHRFPTQSYEAVEAEIADNRRALAPVGNPALRHFCYPSGDYDERQISWLPRLGIVSATTIKAGFTRRGDSPYELPRFLDSERVSLLEFEAELSGFFELIRRCGYAI
ncbi:polysaccharide deacetylase family protein [Pelagibius marinus]|uniref:polysaccharide deacetylase family protein n=1 Tax=Pelagibius marinus TaxID=2762760 RepID=UPI00187264F5|nr:polysaccharide deacetylase family protein [Pelagibius marinus]